MHIKRCVNTYMSRYAYTLIHTCTHMRRGFQRRPPRSTCICSCQDTHTHAYINAHTCAEATKDDLLAVHVFVHVKEGTEEKFKELSVENAKNSVQEAGIARFDVLQVCMHTYIYAYMHAYRNAYMHTSMCKRLELHGLVYSSYAYRHACIRAYIHFTDIYTWYIHPYTHIHVCIHTYMCAYTHTCVHTHIHTSGMHTYITNTQECIHT